MLYFSRVGAVNYRSYLLILLDSFDRKKVFENFGTIFELFSGFHRFLIFYTW